MLFNSVIFLYLFLPVTYFVYWNLHTKKSRYLWLTITGYVFYGWWNAKFCLLMLFSTLVSYTAGRIILTAGNNKLKKRAMITAVVVDLSLLGFFKYYNFAAWNLNSLMDIFSLSGRHFPVLSIILPVGISFYTFHTMSYVIDSYRGTIKPTRDFFEFSCYVSLFSQLVAGPIVRFRQIESDLENIDKVSQFSKLNDGLSFFLVGLFKKVLIADSIAVIIDPAFHRVDSMGTLGAWALALGYTYQLYFDFSGYSDMAVGLGFMFGIRIPQNFNSPYKAVSISDFWRRWHISLSSWLRDYLYIPLGGNRGGELRTQVNLLITMLLGGLWHGANWTFVVWGAFHGVCLILNRLNPFKSIPKIVSQVFTFLVVVVGWVFFRSADMREAGRLLAKMFTLPLAGEVPGSAPTLWCFISLAAFIAHTQPNSTEMNHRHSWAVNVGFAGLFFFSVMRILSNENTPFLYFQF